MSSRAWRVPDGGSVAPFVWHGPAPGPRQHAAPRPAAADPPSPADTEPPTVSHESRLAAIERDAFAKGFAQGERAGADSAAQRGEAMLRRLAQTLDELTDIRAQIVHQTERQMVELALAVARRIVRREVTLDHDLLVAMARVALERLGESARVTIRLHPDEYAATAGARAGQLAGTHVTVVADAGVPRGGCRVESDFGDIDAGVDAQIQELARALLGEEEGAARDTGR